MAQEAAPQPHLAIIRQDTELCEIFKQSGDDAAKISESPALETGAMRTCCFFVAATFRQHSTITAHVCSTYSTTPNAQCRTVGFNPSNNDTKCSDGDFEKAEDTAS